MEDPDRPGDHACPHTLVTSIPDGIHKHKHTHNVNRWIEANGKVGPRSDTSREIRQGSLRFDRSSRSLWVSCREVITALMQPTSPRSQRRR